jgi:Icc-related predicted phosphoesterase
MRLVVIGDFHGIFSEKLKRKIKSEKADLIVGVGDYGGIDDWRPWIYDMFKLSKKGGEWISAEDYFGEKRMKQIIKKDEIATKRALNGLNELGKGVFIFGNGDDGFYRYPFAKSTKIKKSIKRFVKSLKNLRNINYGSASIYGINLLGFGGYMDVMANWDKRKEGDLESYKKMMKRVKLSKFNLFSRLRKKKADILVLHYPPKGVFDKISDRKNPYHGKSAGISFFRDAILRFKPKIALCGHMHEYQGVKRLGKTLVINPGDASKGRFAVVDYDDVNGKVDVRFVK